MDEKIDVLITVNIADHLLSKLPTISPLLNIQAIKAGHVDDIPPDVWATAEVLYTGRVIPAPELAPNIKWIQFHFSGINAVIGSEILKREGLIATTMSGASASQVAEYIVMMMLSLGHRLPEMIENQKKGIWPKDRWEKYQRVELRNATVGIIGYGSIGRQVARLLNSFGATVYATKRDVMHPADRGYSIEGLGDPQGDYVHRLYPAEALQSMVKEVDFLVVSVPLTDSTRDLINSDLFQNMKESAFIIDASRGGVINQNALITALKEKKIAGAALDVFLEEPLPADHPYWKIPNLIITPHIAGITPRYNERAMQLFSENLKRYLEGQPLVNQVEMNLGY